MIRQYSIVNYDFGSQPDSRQEGFRPALIVQTDHLNNLEGYPLTVIVPISHTGRPSPSHVRLEPSSDNDLDAVSYAKCEQIYTVPKALLGEVRGKVSGTEMYAVKQALRSVLTL
jgi:mRNA-degrading endonuclease toxin of MazEF toxin-antitoxin module